MNLKVASVLFKYVLRIETLRMSKFPLVFQWGTIFSLRRRRQIETQYLLLNISYLTVHGSNDLSPFW